MAVTPASLFDALFQREGINFFVTNRIPRRQLSRLIRWFSDIEHPMVRDVSIRLFAWFAGDLRLHEAKKTAFASLHDCFIRELKPGLRPVAPGSGVFVSPCDGVVVASGRIDGTELVQAKGMTYTAAELLDDPRGAEPFRGGRFVALRLAACMYHRFHAPCDGRVERVVRVPGDRWNVNPPALKRIPRVYCLNERAIVHMRAADGEPMTLVAVGAVLVGSVRVHRVEHCGKGDELGYFEFGSTIVVLAPDRLDIDAAVDVGATLRMGQPLFRRRQNVGDAIAQSHAVSGTAGADVVVAVSGAPRPPIATS